MTRTKTHLVLFGDASASCHASIRALYGQASTSPVLRSYLNLTWRRLQSIVRHCAKRQRQNLFGSKSLLELSDVHEEDGRRDTAVTFALATACQLGWLILQVEKEPHFLLSTCSKRLLLGFCSGMLSALAAAFATNLNELLELSPQLVCASFEVGRALSARSALIEGTEDSWARVLQGLDEERTLVELQKFHSDTDLPPYKHAYISAKLPMTTTVTAPPSTLASLFAKSDYLRQAMGPSIASAQALHCPYLELPDVEAVFKQISSAPSPRFGNIYLVSPSSGKTLASFKSLYEALHEVLVEIFRRPISWERVEKSLSGELAGTDTVLFTIGSTYASRLLSKSLCLSSIISYSDKFLTSDSRRTQWDRNSDAIAIVGMAGRFPGGNDPDEFWRMLEKGGDMHEKIPADRFDIDRHFDSTGQTKNAARTRFGCFIDRPDLFDAPFFHMSPREASQTDPSHRLLLMTVYEALEMAGYQRDRTAATHRCRMGTFFGQTNDDYREANISQNIDGAFYTTGGDRAFGPGRLNYFFGWEGPSCSVDAACSSSSVSLQLACRALQARDCDTALAGGTNIMTSPSWFAGLSRGGFLSPSGACKTWDETADGYCRGDGVGSVVLKRLEDAIADKDNVLGVIKAIHTNHSARASSITQPHASTQAKLLREVLRDSDVMPGQIDFVECHGTATQVGDIHETTALLEVFGQSRRHPLYIGSVKPNIGHGEASSGIASLVKALLMLKNRMIPPHAGIKTVINKRIPDLASKGILIPRTLVPFSAGRGPNEPLRILVNNFNATGGNTCFVLEEYTERATTRHEEEIEDERSAQVITISANSTASLQSSLLRLATFLKSKPHIRLSDLAYTTTARRTHHQKRVAFPVQSCSELVAALETGVQATPSSNRPAGAPRIVFSFTGQGNSAVSSDNLVKQLGLPSFLHLIKAAVAEPSEERPEVVPLALAALELALAQLWQSWGLFPSLVIGHSIGEYPALCVAGVISQADMFYLIGRRTELIKKHCRVGTHGMLATNVSALALKEHISRLGLSSCSVSCYNSASSTAIGGAAEELDILQSVLTKDHCQAYVLKVPYAFHTAQVASVVSEYETVANNVTYSRPEIPIASTLLGEIVTDEHTINASYIARQTYAPVNFLDAAKACLNRSLVDDNTLWLEIGPRPFCLSMIKTILNPCQEHMLSSLDPVEDAWMTISRSLSRAYESGVNVQWLEFHQPFENLLRLQELPSYSFDLKRHWVAYQGTWALHRDDDSKHAVCKTLRRSRISDTLHYVVSEESTNENISVTFESDLQDNKLHEAIAGHSVNGEAICPSGVFADMAMTAAVYIWKQNQEPGIVPSAEVSNLQIIRPLILGQSGSSQVIQLKATWEKNADSTRVTVSSDSSAKAVKHASCTINIGDTNAWTEAWAKQAYLYQTRIDQLVAPGESDEVNRLSRKLIYKSFSTLVDYGPRYRGIHKVSVQYDISEAVASIKFDPGAEAGSYTCNPYWIDNLCHVSGFVLNTADTLTEETVYISNGWASMRVACALSASSTYQAYVRMQAEGEKGLMAGDVVVFENQKVVAMFSGIKFQAVTRQVLTRLLQSSQSLRSDSPTDDTLEKTPIGTETSHGSAYGSAEPPKAASAPSMSSNAPSKTNNLADKFHVVLASELGVSAKEIQPDASFADLGIDSLLGLSIIDAVRNQLGLTIPASFFFDHPTLADAQIYFANKESSPHASLAQTRPPLPESQPVAHDRSVSSRRAHTSTDSRPRPVSLHSPRSSSDPPIHLLPDGSGSASSYAALPFSSLTSMQSRQVIGYDSPFVHSPSDYPEDFMTVAKLYATVVHDQQPTGPYVLGGWSIGGIYAYETALELARQGHTIASVILIDSPCPLTVPPLQGQTVRLLEKVGVFAALKAKKDGGRAMQNLLEHFEKGARALGGYTPRLWSEVLGSQTPPPSVTIAWAGKGVCESISEEAQGVLERERNEKDESQRWVLEPRKDAGPGGWEQLFGQGCRVKVVKGVDHFGIVRRPEANELAMLIAEAASTPA